MLLILYLLGIIRMDITTSTPSQESIVEKAIKNGDSLHICHTSAKTPLRDHVHVAVTQYLSELDDQLPTSLYQTVIQEVERPLLEVVLAKTQGNQSKSAKILGLNRGTLRKKLELYGLM